MVALINENLRNYRPLRRRGALVELGVLVGSAVGRWARQIREAEELAGLDDRELKDIGLTQAEVGMLIDRPFWHA